MARRRSSSTSPRPARPTATCSPACARRSGRRHGLLAPCLLVAERQTAGRGRHGRPWRSTPGASLTFSLAWPLTRADLSGLSLAVGVALADALDATATPRIGLKWPNDLWLVADWSEAARRAASSAAS